MKAKRKSLKPASKCQRDLLEMIDDYVAETGDRTPEMIHVAAWAYQKGRHQPQARSVIGELAKLLQGAARQEYILDDNGDPVRRKHSWKEKVLGKTKSLWANIEDATPEQMKLSAQGRRGGILADCVQLNRDVNHYNKHYNPGDSIQLTFDFNPDLVETTESGEYSDTPPEDKGDDTATK